MVKDLEEIGWGETRRERRSRDLLRQGPADPVSRVLRQRDMADLQAPRRAFIGAALGGPELYEGTASMKAGPSRLGNQGRRRRRGGRGIRRNAHRARCAGPTIGTIAGPWTPLKTEIVS